MVKAPPKRRVAGNHADISRALVLASNPHVT